MSLDSIVFKDFLLAFLTEINFKNFSFVLVSIMVFYNRYGFLGIWHMSWQMNGLFVDNALNRNGRPNFWKTWKWQIHLDDPIFGDYFLCCCCCWLLSQKAQKPKISMKGSIQKIKPWPPPVAGSTHFRCFRIQYYGHLVQTFGLLLNWKHETISQTFIT